MTDYRISALAVVMILAACGGETPDPGTQNSASEPAVETETAAADATGEIAINPDKNAYFGDLHVHTGNSFDAFIFGTRATPDAAYRFAKGETIRHDGGYEIALEGPPLDFLAVTDHGEYIGIIPQMANPLSALNKTATAQAIFGRDAVDPPGAFLAVGATIVSGEEIEDIYDRDTMDNVWARTVQATETHNNPGTFTTFAGYEFTAMVQLDYDGALAAANLHRNVIFRDEAPERLFTTLDSTNPEDLWNWMDDQRAEGREVLSIPHNSNASNGEMFATESYLGDALTATYATQRLRNEPIVEISQIKGTSETHPSLSPNDEFSGFEQYEYYIGSSVTATVGKGDFVRTAYMRGLEMQAEEGFNPFKFGLIGSSDTHIGAATLVEKNHWGKFPTDGAGPASRLSVPPGGASEWPTGPIEADARVLAAPQFSSSGLAGVWAVSNTREAIFDAMARKETFGTSGPRMRVRLFGGFGYDAEMLSAPDLTQQAYAGGVPMGGNLISTGEAPVFLAWAMQDALSAPLQRLQMVKVWTDESGRAQERIYDAACSGGARPDAATRRCPDNGASVDITTCNTQTGSGQAELKTLWSDPDYQAGQEAIYYVRVLENPTCRWSTWDAVRNGTPPNPNLDTIVQERAWTSPIFVTPG